MRNPAAALLDINWHPELHISHSINVEASGLRLVQLMKEEIGPFHQPGQLIGAGEP